MLFICELCFTHVFTAMLQKKNTAGEKKIVKIPFGLFCDFFCQKNVLSK